MNNEKASAANLRLAATAEENGGPYVGPKAYQGSMARTMFDRPAAKDGTVTLLIPEDEIGNLPRQSLVKIASYDRRAKVVDGEYVGMVVSGPFAEPDAMDADAPTLKLPAVHGAVLTPRFHGVANVEILGLQVTAGGRTMVIPAQRRPAPNSPVFLLENDRVQQVLGLVVQPENKPFRLGLMNGAADIEVLIPAAQKSVLPRHLGVLGTTGGGKSTTVSGMALRLAKEGNAVVIFDTEGEYAAMCEPTADPAMLRALAERGLQAEGSGDTALYVLEGCDSAYPDHPNEIEYKLDFADISIGVLTELLDIPEAQQSRLSDAYDIAKTVMDKLEIYPAKGNRAEQQQALEIDELETGWPRMTLEMLIDVVSAAISHTQKLTEFGLPPLAFGGSEDVVFKAVKEKNIESNKYSWLGLNKKLWKLKRAKLFAARSSIDVKEMLTPGRISIIDLHDMDAPYLRNIVIAQILRRIQSCQETVYAARQTVAEAAPVTPVNIFIEEAHEFLSDRRIRQMPNLFEQVVRIARRGRKRHLGLVFITQLPGHLPDEVLGLINNWILHKIGDANVVQRLKKILSGADEGTWSSLTSLPSGHALASFTHMTRPVTVTVDPTPCKLLMVD